MRRLGCFFLAVMLLGTAPGPGTRDVNEATYWREQYALLQSLPPARQQQLHDLDRDFHALDKESQERLRKVMDNYNYWLAHLSEKERKRVIDAATAHERLKIIEEFKEREWIETLPKTYRDKYAKASQIERIHLVIGWREEQHERREEWQFVRRNWDELRDDRFAPILQSPEFRQQLDSYVLNLESQLSASDRERLRKAKEILQEERAWFRYLTTVVDLADRYTLLPGPLDGPRHFDSLPKLDKEALERHDKFKKKNLPKDLQNTSGRWPEFAIAVTEYAHKHGIKLPVPLGPTDKQSMPPEIKAFISEKLEPALLAVKGDKAEQAKRDLARLHDAAGKWPDYPRTVIELAKQYKYMPGWMLPGEPKIWERFRIRKIKK